MAKELPEVAEKGSCGSGDRMGTGELTQKCGKEMSLLLHHHQETGHRAKCKGWAGTWLLKLQLANGGAEMPSRYQNKMRTRQPPTSTSKSSRAPWSRGTNQDLSSYVGFG
ncbi:hypothetical protein KOW79_022458 [Hemibagrus wyckioides]|uniref:Uncharacterized protein n=1 Tax=Hemibagrus wyckioides TaxID=337641 RepID=A0A9D3N188_9TELE|nr:hypothetical protein KOW79_022458 [Hemibagrus wyckioides]